MERIRPPCPRFGEVRKELHRITNLKSRGYGERDRPAICAEVVTGDLDIPRNVAFDDLMWSHSKCFVERIRYIPSMESSEAQQ